MQSPAQTPLELVISRISHDLASPLGAIANGVELLELSAHSPELDLIKLSIAAALAKLKVMRGAFGPTNRSERISLVDISAFLQTLSSLSRHKFSLKASQSLTAKEHQLLCLALLTTETALPHGGEVVITLSDTRKWEIIASGRTARDVRELPEAIDASHIHLPLFWDAIAARHPKYHLTATRLQITF